MKSKLILAVYGTEEGLVLLHQVLVHLGHAVVLASNGREAVDQAARHRPDAIVLDLSVPGGGWRETLRALATEGWAATTPIIALAEGAETAVWGERFAAVVRRPIVLPVLAAALEACLPATPAGVAV